MHRSPVLGEASAFTYVRSLCLHGRKKNFFFLAQITPCLRGNLSVWDSGPAKLGRKPWVCKLQLRHVTLDMQPLGDSFFIAG